MADQIQLETNLESEHGASTTVASSVYDQLRVDIVTGSLRPGEKLRSEYLRGRYNAGISPVREALNRLVSERFVCREDQRGFHVAGVSKADLAALTQTRCWLEEIALRQSIENGGQAWEEDIVLAFHRLSRTPRLSEISKYVFNPEWERRHREFHLALVAECGSHWLLGFCAQLLDHSDRYRQLAAAVSPPRRKDQSEHRDLMQAALDRDADRAVKLACAHFRKTADVVLKADLNFIPDELDPRLMSHRRI